MDKGVGVVSLAISLLIILMAVAPSHARGDSVSCKGSMGECTVGGDEFFEMESGMNRRILATTKFISYQALLQNSVPCSQRGASYYNCQPGAESNAYTRGCTAITRCRV